MRSKMMCGAIVSLLLAVSGWAADAAGYQAIVDQSYALAAGGSVSLDNVNGDVSIEVWENSEVRIYAVKSASSPELLELLLVEVDAEPDAVRINTHYPSTRDSKYDKEDHSQVEYTLTVPRSAKIDDVDLVNGSLTVVGVEGGVKAETVNGNIVVRECSGSAALSTVNGGIELYTNRLDRSEDVALEAVNGSLDLYLAAAIGAEVQAESVNGTIRNDFGLEVHKGKYVGSDLSGVIGGGGGNVQLETVNGSIDVHAW
jgi:DUF4097 and DUF4098 domain-containing protein YvlB